jgi:DNA-binding transcriptional LysR family regulator
MNLRSVDLNLFPVFEAIYTERSLTRAAEVLNVTQPAVSNALARLRAAFGDPLFERSRRGVAPTPAAQALIGPVRDALTRLRAGMDQQARFAAATSTRAFNISMRGDTGASALLPPLVRLAQREAPGVRFHVHQYDRAEIPHEMAASRLDFAIDTPDLGRSELDSTPILTDRYVFVVRRGHELAKARLTLKRFLAQPQIAVSSRRIGRGLLDLALDRIGERVRPVMRLPNYQAAFHIVMGSDLALVVPQSLVKRYDVAWRELPFDPPILRLLLFWRHDAADDPAVQWAREKIIAAAGPQG